MTTTLIKKSLLLVAPLALMATLVTPLSAYAAEATRYITVSAEGSVKVTPDAVSFNATVSVVASTNKDAVAQTSTKAAAVRKALLAAGVATKDISTRSITAYPEYKYDNNGGSTLVGYRGSQSFAVTIRNAAAAGDVVDAVVAAGGDSLQVNSVTPFVINGDKASEAARAAAVKKARAKALSYAKLLGVKLGKVNYLTESGPFTTMTPVYTASAKSADEATVVDLGQQDLTVSVTIQWSL